MSMPFDPATSIRTPRVTRPPTCSDPELLESRARADVAELEAIVEAVAPHLVREGVELRADLAELGDDELLVDLASIRYRWRRLGVDVEDAAGVDEGRSEERRVGKECTVRRPSGPWRAQPGDTC